MLTGLITKKIASITKFKHFKEPFKPTSQTNLLESNSTPTLHSFCYGHIIHSISIYIFMFPFCYWHSFRKVLTFMKQTEHRNIYVERCTSTPEMTNLCILRQCSPNQRHCSVSAVSQCCHQTGSLADTGSWRQFPCLCSPSLGLCREAEEEGDICRLERRQWQCLDLTSVNDKYYTNKLATFLHLTTLHIFQVGRLMK